MTNLPNHLDFEKMLRPRGKAAEGAVGTYDKYVVINFSATWCGPCQRLDKAAIVKATPAAKWYYVDVDENEVTLGYCNLRSIPSFALIVDGYFKGVLEGIRGPDHVLSWLQENGVPVKE